MYVSHLVDAAVQQSYDSNLMIANQVRFALQNALETGLKDQTSTPTIRPSCGIGCRTAINDSESLRATLDSANMYSTTEYDVNIVDTQVAHSTEHVSGQ